MGGKADAECKDCQHRKKDACVGDDDAAEARIKINGTCYEEPPNGSRDKIIVPAVPRYPFDKRPLVTNAMKAECIGEFHVEVEHTCPHCLDADEAEDECEVCQGKTTIKYQVPWDTMKEIYRAMVKAAQKEATC